jgi:hypothetical protein
MSRNAYALVAAAMAIGLVASGCSSSPNTTKTTSPASATQLQSLIPTPANTQRTDGPVSIPDNGIHMHFLVNGLATDVLDTYKTALEGKGWAVTVVSSGGWGGAGGATYTGTQGDTYGVQAEEAPLALPTSVRAHGRQSPRTPTVVAATDDNGDDWLTSDFGWLVRFYRQ